MMQPKALESKLSIYEGLLRKWQPKINLVSSQSLSELRLRHFEDSLQLAALIEPNLSVYDLGSGGGFPGLVLAMARPDLAISLIESDQRKCAFLKTVSRETSTPVNVFSERIEDVAREAPDVITARALAPVKSLLFLTAKWTEKSDTTCYFLKGQNFEEEIGHALEAFEFQHKIFKSVTNPNAAILQINKICAKMQNVNNK
ncbi:MAG: 16S rRNA (guanine(527)-N(7))-methyltransferase RsmG [Alphaproteobacteria bacterium]|nr:16S rRNA (guanine(527)-N(7))-methyltransferase RsmG [Alphaproteobacteria bacterium]|tara:strand:+ start:292 stop:894 length:603 start_codon:yes stop_codon:yes gene_type:complete